MPYLCRKTKEQKRTLDPTFNTMFLFKLNLNEMGDSAMIHDFVLDIEVRDNDRFNKQIFLGMVSIPLDTLMPSNERENANNNGDNTIILDTDVENVM